MEPLATRHGFSLMDMNRFNNILTSIRGYDVTSRTGDCRDDAWLQRKNLLRNLNELEQKVFKRSMDWLFNRESGSLVVDDWLVSSRAKDVEAKTYSDRKAGKDGCVAHCLADSTICLLLGMYMCSIFTYCNYYHWYCTSFRIYPYFLFRILIRNEIINYRRETT